MIIGIDADTSNADWTKRTWDLPIDADAFLTAIAPVTLAEFEKLPAAEAMPRELHVELVRRGLRSR